MTRDEIDTLWQRALMASVRDGETFTRYHFAAMVRNEVLEEAAKCCDEIEKDRWALYKGRPPYTGKEKHRASDYTQGESDGASQCADDIRALKDKT